MRLHRSIAALALLLATTSCNRAHTSAPAEAHDAGKVTVVYEDDSIKPENRDLISQLRASGAFERMADRLGKAVALPHDLQIVVTDKLPRGVDDVPNYDLEGGRIYWPASFVKQSHDVLSEFVPQAISSKGVPKAIAEKDFTADTLNVWSNQFILGHEMGHAVIDQLKLPVTGMEEDSADGFATFLTNNDPATGPKAAFGAAVLFDAMSHQAPALLQDYSSDHMIILQRVYNFLCAALGKDPEGLRSLQEQGYVPESRAWLCGKEWAQLNYGWWTELEPHLKADYRQETESIRQQAAKNLESEKAALWETIKQMRSQPASAH